MATQKTPVIITEYNLIQSKVAHVLGVGADDYGYGQTVYSSQINESTKPLISADQWNVLRSDMLRVRQHQTGIDESGNIPTVYKNTSITAATTNSYLTMAELIHRDRALDAPLSQSTREPLVSASRTSAWNNTLTHSITVNFENQNAARWYFNAGSSFEFSASRTGGSSTTKNTSWTNLLDGIGVISFSRLQTRNINYSTTTSVGYANLTQTNKLVYEKYDSTPSFELNRYAVYAKLGTTSAQVIFTIEFSDIADGSGDPNIDGNLLSSMKICRASGHNVTVARPAAISTFTGGTVTVAPVIPAVVPTYTVTRNTTAITEGGVGVVFTVTTTNVPSGTILYWSTSTSTGLTPADFSDETYTGTVIINNGSGTITRIAKDDLAVENTESFAIQIRTFSTTGSIVAQSEITDIQDIARSYSVTPASNSIIEGQTQVVFTVNTVNVPGNTVLYWTTSGNGITANDFVDESLSGVVVISNNVGTISRIAKADLLVEGTEVFEIQIRTDSISGPIKATSASVKINDLAGASPYVITRNAPAIVEGGRAVFTITTTGLPSPTTLYWTTSVSAGITEADFSDNTLSGTVEINNNSGIITREAVSDLSPEGAELFAIQLRTNSITGSIVATSELTSITDALSSYTVTPNKTTINEDGTTEVTFTVNTVNIADSTLYWTVSGANVSANDFTDNLNSGTVIITNNTGTFTRIARADITTEGDESFEVQIRTGSITGPIKTSSAGIIIKDTSFTTNPLTPTYNIIQNIGKIGEGSTGVTFNIITENVPNGATLYWTTLPKSGDVSSSDFSDYLASGQVTIKNNSASIIRIANPDKYTEGEETFCIELRTGSIAGPVVQTSSAVVISDLSTTPVVVSYLLERNTSSIAEGQGVTFDVYTTGIPDGTILYWSTLASTSQLTAADFSDNTLSGTVVIYNNQSSEPIIRTAAIDLTSETAESFAIQLKTTQNGSAVYTSQMTSITDAIVAANTTVSSLGVTAINESGAGASVLFSVTTTTMVNGTLYWTLVGTNITANDFTSNTLSGPVTITNGAGSFTITAKADSLTETGGESFEVEIRNGAGSLLATSAPGILINDTSTTTPSQYIITADTGLVYEGPTTLGPSGVIFTVYTQGIPVNTRLYWTTKSTVGSVVAADFSDSLDAGTFLIKSDGTATVTRVMSVDYKSEGTEKFCIELRSDAGPTSTLLRTSPEIEINDLSLTPTIPTVKTYNIIRDKSTIGETGANNTVTFTVSTTNVSPSETLYWTTTPVGVIQPTDFSDNKLSGTVNVDTTGKASIVRTAAADGVPENTESFAIQLRTGGFAGLIVQTSEVTTITDTFVEPTITIDVSQSQINEGGKGVTFTIYTTNLPNNALLYWTLSNDKLTADDFVESKVRGTFTVTNNVGKVTLTANADVITEGDMSFELQVRTGGYDGTIRQTSSGVIIKDDSQTQKVYNLAQSATMIGEGTTGVEFTVTTVNVPKNTVLFWVIPDAAGLDEFDLNKRSAELILDSSGAGNFSITALTDNKTEGGETFEVQLRTGSKTGPVVQTSQGILILDTSQNPSYGMTISPASGNINETTNKTFSVTLNVANVASNSTMYLSFGGSATYGTDYALLSGPSLTKTGNIYSFSTSGSAMTWQFEVSPDLKTEGYETAFIEVMDVLGGPVLRRSSTFTIEDTSKAPSYAVTISPSKPSEGSLITTTIQVANIVVGTVLTAFHSGTAGDNDLSPDGTAPAIAGTFTVTQPTITWKHTVVADHATEGSQTFAWVFKDTAGVTVATSNTITINDTSLFDPSGTLTITPLVVNEGDLVTFTFTNQYFKQGTLVYPKFIYTTGSDTGDWLAVSGQGFNDNGSFVVTGSPMVWTALVTVDLITEGQETVYVELHTESVTGPLLCTSDTIVINDSSKKPLAIAAGETLSFNAAVATNSDVYWKVIYDNQTFPRFGGLTRGIAPVMSNVANVQIPTVGDYNTTEDQLFAVKLYTDENCTIPVSTVYPINAKFKAQTALVGNTTTPTALPEVKTLIAGAKTFSSATINSGKLQSFINGISLIPHYTESNANNDNDAFMSGYMGLAGTVAGFRTNPRNITFANTMVTVSMEVRDNELVNIDLPVNAVVNGITVISKAPEISDNKIPYYKLEVLYSQMCDSSGVVISVSNIQYGPLTNQTIVRKNNTQCNITMPDGHVIRTLRAKFTFGGQAQRLAFEITAQTALLKVIHNGG